MHAIVLVAILALIPCEAITVLKDGVLSADSKIVSEKLVIELTYEGVGVTGNFWVAIGFGTVMTNTDVITCMYDSGTTTCVDRFATARSLPGEDTGSCSGTASVAKVSDSYVADTKYMVSFTREFKTNDTDCDLELEEGKEIDIIWAYGTVGSSMI